MKSVIISTLALSLLAAAQTEVEFASFGQRHSLDLGYLPGWNLGGTQAPQVLTDKIIFTPPYPGEVSASAWTTQRLNSRNFIINAKVHASGQEHAGGSLSIWYTKEGESAIHSDTLYTAGKFTGLVISIDQRGGPAGGIRGFLNDGTISFRHHAHLDTAAFGHCDYAYRNRGLPSDLQIKYDNNGLEVSIDHKLCFRADKVSLPHDYYLGLTAASSATPDSFEVASFITTTITSQTQTQNQNQNNQNTNQNNNQQQQEPLSIEHIRDALATTLQSSTDQFTDLHTRLQSIGHNTENLFTEYRRSSAALAGRIEELHSKLARYDQLQGVQAQIANLEHAVQELRRSLQSGRGEGAANTANAAATADAERDGRWGVGSYCFVLLLVVGLAVGGFGLWKRRGEDGWKGGKYL